MFTDKYIRSQLDNFDEITEALGLRCPPEDNRTRQEFKDEADINNVVSRFYPFAPPQARVPVYGERDMSLDLHGALMVVQEARESYASLPESLRAKFPTYSEFVNAVADGRVQIIDQSSAGAEGSSSAPAGGSPSESAAGGGADA